MRNYHLEIFDKLPSITALTMPKATYPKIANTANVTKNSSTLGAYKITKTEMPRMAQTLVREILPSFL